MANNSSKLLSRQSSGPHCWTFFSTAAYGKRNKVPQIVEYFQSGGDRADEFAVGLHLEFQQLQGRDIGSVPVLEEKLRSSSHE